jgi:hypothetical protein
MSVWQSPYCLVAAFEIFFSSYIVTWNRMLAKLIVATALTDARAVLTSAYFLIFHGYLYVTHCINKKNVFCLLVPVYKQLLSWKASAQFLF